MRVSGIFDPGCCGALLAATLGLFLAASPAGGEPPRQDRIPGPGGELEITFLGHASLILSAGGTVVHVDPYGKVADYATLPKADLVLVTHEHYDHSDAEALAAVSKATTRIVASAAAAALEGVKGATVLENAGSATVAGIAIQAVPAYNVKHERSPGVPFHPKGRGNGYVLTMAGLKVYVAGDTENIPEMKALSGVDVAFLPMNLPYTMTPEMAADAARMLRPRILYPYHTGETDTAKLVELLKDTPSIEVRIRKMP